MRLVKDHILKKVGEDVVLVPLSQEETDFRGMIVLNHTGEFLCRMLQQETSRDKLIAGLIQEYGAEPTQAEKDVDAFLSELDACHMLVH